MSAFEEVYAKMDSFLRAADTRRESVISRYRPMMALFAFYLFICFLFPYVDFGVPRYLRGNLFWFLAIVGCLALAIVLIIYYQHFTSVQRELRAAFLQRLSAVMDKEWYYAKEDQSLEGYLRESSFHSGYDTWVAENYIAGNLQEMVVQQVDLRLLKGEMYPLPKQKLYYEGNLLVCEFDHYFAFSGNAKFVIRNPSRFRQDVLKSFSDTETRDWFESLDSFAPWLNQHVFERRFVKEPVHLIFQSGRVIMIWRRNQNFADHFNWQSWRDKDFFASQVWPFHFVIYLNQELREHGATNN